MKNLLKKIKRIRKSKYLGRYILLNVPPISTVYGLYRRIRYSWPVWFKIINKDAHKRYEEHAQSLNEVQQRIVDDLKREGISIVHFHELFSEEELKVITDLAEQHASQPEIQAQITSSAEENSGKSYLVRPFGETPNMNLNNKLMALTVNEKILGIVNSYLDMFSRLRAIELWYNKPVVGKSTYSQNWHRDPEDKKLVKMFLYLRDVDETAGPFHYVPQTHHGGKNRNTFPPKPFQGIYPDSVAVDSKFKEEILQCTGKTGTIIFCDTSGLHKGGYAISKARYLLNAIYTTNASNLKNRYQIADKSEFDQASPPVKYALQLA